MQVPSPFNHRACLQNQDKNNIQAKQELFKEVLCKNTKNNCKLALISPTTSYTHSLGFFRISVSLYSLLPGAGLCMYSHLAFKGSDIRMDS